jgi:electron transfer flavoprotein beta subunit
MMNMRAVMPALQKAKPAAIGVGGLVYEKVEIPAQKRATRIVKDATTDEIAKEIVEWLKA